MSVIFRYITRELIAVFLVCTLILLVILLGSRFVSYMQDAAVGKYSASAVLTLMGFRLPEFIQVTLPLGYYLGVVLAVGRLSADQELTVLTAGGASPWRMLSWVVSSGVIVAMLATALSGWVTPRVNGQFAAFLEGQRVEGEFQGMTPGVFQSFQQGRRVTYAEDVSSDRKRLDNVFIAEQQDNGDTVTMWAKTGTQYFDEDTGSRFLLLRDGRRYNGRPGRARYQVVDFGLLSQRIEALGGSSRRPPTESMLTRDLISAGTPEAGAELHWRLAIPLFAINGALLGFALGKVGPRRGRYARMGPAVAVFLIYYMLALVNRNLIEQGSVPPILGIWVVHGAFLAVAVQMLKRSYRPSTGRDFNWKFWVKA
jgi:lipopolysaccharide export system permease protein